MIRRSSDAVTLLVPSAVAAVFVAVARHGDRMLAAAAWPLLALWAIACLALSLRWIGASRRGGAGPTLTGAGRSMMYAGCGAIVLGAITGWASLSLLGVLGLGSAFLALTWTSIVAGSDAPWRGATIERAILPESAIEGDALREHVRLAGVKIPVGTRLFVTGRPLPRGVVTRHCASADASGGELELDSELGPAPRGEHEVPGLAMWLGDVFGLVRGPIVHRGETALTVLPRPDVVEGARHLLGVGGDDATAVPVQRMPTEGTFRIREYQQGDDTRRIHWVRSLQLDQLVVRLPDEIPPAEPRARVVLDTYLWVAELTPSLAADRLLDALVRVWLGVGKALAEHGASVTMVAARHGQKGGVILEKPMIPRAPREALRLGAGARWQTVVPLGSLVDAGAVRNIVVSARPHAVHSAAEISWVVVPDTQFVGAEPAWPSSSPVTLPFPIGSGDNRLSRRRAEQWRIAEIVRDHAILHDTLCGARPFPRGVFVARPNRGRIALEAAS
jgi:hypothetical protein